MSETAAPSRATRLHALAAVIVGAGAGRRFGGPKAAARLSDGRRFVDVIAAIAHAAGLDPIVVVLPPGVPPPAPDRAQIRTVVNANSASEQIDSVRLGLAQLANAAVSAAVVWPVDHPFARLESVLAVMDAERRHGASIVIPVFEGRRGHPTLFHRDVWRELMVAGAEGARAVVRRDRARVHEVDVGDAGVRLGITTREDLDRATAPRGE